MHSSEPVASENETYGNFDEGEISQIKNRLSALKFYQECHNKLETDLKNEMSKLERKYQELMDPLYTKRQEIVTGKREPSNDEATTGVETDLSDLKSFYVPTMPGTTPMRGIPCFWLNVLRNCSAVGPAIQVEDAIALASLLDIRCIPTNSSADGEESRGFSIQFLFDQNEYFTNDVLEKSFYFSSDVDEFCEENFLYAKGTPIEWKEGKCLTSKKITKSQRNKKTGATRNVTEVVEVPSFFSFFKTIEGPSQEDDASQMDSEDFEMFEQQIYEEYYVGELLRTRIIPYAFDWFCGTMSLAEEDSGHEGNGCHSECGDSDCGGHCDYELDEEEEDDEDMQCQTAKPECKNQ